MNEQAIEELKNSLRDVISMVTQRGQPLTPDLKSMIAQVMEHVATRITELRAQSDIENRVNEGESPLEAEANEFRQEVSDSNNAPPLDQQIPQPEIPQQTPQSAPGVPLKMSRGMPSSNVHSFAYDDKNGNLYVRFQDKWPMQNGPVYKYSNVEPQIFNLFKIGAIPPKTSGRNAWHEWKKGLAPSLGASLNQLLKKGGYSFTRLN